MMTDKHTPGPWIEDDSFIRTSDGTPIALGYTNKSEWRANLRLIEAAPELLEAATWLVHLMHNIGKNGGPPSDMEYEEAGTFAKAAIAKATGGKA